MTSSVVNTAKEGEISNEPGSTSDINSWMSENKQFINDKMSKSIKENELTLDMLLTADKQELAELANDLGYNGIQKRKFIHAVELHPKSCINAHNILRKFITITPEEQKAIDSTTKLITKCTEITQKLIKQKKEMDINYKKSVETVNLAFADMKNLINDVLTNRQNEIISDLQNGKKKQLEQIESTLNETKLHADALQEALVKQQNVLQQSKYVQGDERLKKIKCIGENVGSKFDYKMEIANQLPKFNPDKELFELLNKILVQKTKKSTLEPVIEPQEPKKLNLVVIDHCGHYSEDDSYHPDQLLKNEIKTWYNSMTRYSIEDDYIIFGRVNNVSFENVTNVVIRNRNTTESVKTLQLFGGNELRSSKWTYIGEIDNINKSSYKESNYKINMKPMVFKYLKVVFTDNHGFYGQGYHYSMCYFGVEGY